MSWFRARNRLDLQTFERLCEAVEAPLYSYALRLSQNRSEAEDIAQESLLRLYSAMQNGRAPLSPRAYVFSIAHNLAMETYRKNSRPGESTQATLAATDDATERSLLRAQIDRALADLPQHQRAALLLREFGELSYAEIAGTLEASEAQVKVWIHRGRKKLATLLDRDGQYIGTQQHGR